MKPHLLDLIKKLGVESFELYIEEGDEQTLRFVYPQLFKDEALVREIRLEIGSLAAWTPVTQREITPFVAESYPNLFKLPDTIIRTVDAKRTFWEKATILHAEANRTVGRIPPRYSRHYYDMYKLYNSSIKEEAFNDFSLLEQVVTFKTKFYRSNRAMYHEATQHGIRLLPSAENFPALTEDYAKMQSMLFGEIIPFQVILDGLSAMQEEIRKYKA